MTIKSPPGLTLLLHPSGGELLTHLCFNQVIDEKERYPSSDELQCRIKEGENVDMVWTPTRLARNVAIQRVSYYNGAGGQAGFNITPMIAEVCELVDKRTTALALKDQTERLRGAGAKLSQLHLEEPITSSQLEGTNTATLVAGKMLEVGRSPRTEDEHMIAGDTRLVAEIPHLLTEPLAPALIRQLYAIGMGGINDAKYCPGRFRETDDAVIVDCDGNIVHQPPAAVLLPERLEKICQWLNSHEGYVYPLVRACILHFVPAHEHPFRDGNGHTSRALFYWYVLKSGYDIFKYIPISSLLHATSVRYVVNYQYTESDGIDLTHSPEYQTGVIKRVLQNWQQHIDEIIQRSAKLDSVLFGSGVLRHLDPHQVTFLNVMLTNPGKEYTAIETSVSLSVSDNITRADSWTIVKEGFA